MKIKPGGPLAYHNPYRIAIAVSQFHSPFCLKCDFRFLSLSARLLGITAASGSPSPQDSIMIRIYFTPALYSVFFNQDCKPSNPGDSSVDSPSTLAENSNATNTAKEVPTGNSYTNARRQDA